MLGDNGLCPNVVPWLVSGQPILLTLIRSWSTVVMTDKGFKQPRVPSIACRVCLCCHGARSTFPKLASTPSTWWHCRKEAVDTTGPCPEDIPPDPLAWQAKHLAQATASGYAESSRDHVPGSASRFAG